MQVNKSVEVLNDDLEFFIASNCFKSYLECVQNNEGRLIELVLYNVKRSSDTFYSAVAEVTVQFKSGEIQSRNIFLRGKSVIVIPYFLGASGLFFLLVEQNRISLGGSSLEFPAGGIDANEQDNAAAKREVYEETGISVDHERLLLLGKDFFVCESAFTESATWFGYQISKKEINQIQNRKAPQGIDDEIVKTCLVQHEEVKNIKTFQIHCGLSLLHQTLPDVFTHRAFV